MTINASHLAEVAAFVNKLQSFRVSVQESEEDGNGIRFPKRAIFSFRDVQVPVEVCKLTSIEEADMARRLERAIRNVFAECRQAAESVLQGEVLKLKDQDP